MSKLPTHVTYLVGHHDGRERAMCVEASALPRQVAFVRRCGSIQTVRQPLGKGHDGTLLTPESMALQTRQLYRHIPQPVKLLRRPARTVELGGIYASS